MVFTVSKEWLVVKIRPQLHPMGSKSFQVVTAVANNDYPPFVIYREVYAQASRFLRSILAVWSDIEVPAVVSDLPQRHHFPVAFGLFPFGKSELETGEPVKFVLDA